jgi:hypothetical protein
MWGYRAGSGMSPFVILCTVYITLHSCDEPVDTVLTVCVQVITSADKRCTFFGDSLKCFVRSMHVKFFL